MDPQNQQLAGTGTSVPSMGWKRRQTSEEGSDRCSYPKWQQHPKKDKLEKYQELKEELDVKGKGSRAPHDNRRHDPETGRVGPPGTTSEREECSPENIRDTDRTLKIPECSVRGPELGFHRKGHFRTINKVMCLEQRSLVRCFSSFLMWSAHMTSRTWSTLKYAAGLSEFIYSLQFTKTRLQHIHIVTNTSATTDDDR